MLNKKHKEFTSAEKLHCALTLMNAGIISPAEALKLLNGETRKQKKKRLFKKRADKKIDELLK